MAPKWLLSAFVLGLLGCGTARSEVTYMFFDAHHTSTVDLEFAIASQLSLLNPSEPLISTGGVFGADFVGAEAELDQGPPVSVFVSDSTPFAAQFAFTSIHFGEPGNGDFPISGFILENSDALASIGSATVSGVPVPEPSTWVLLIVGGCALVAGSQRRSKRPA